MRIKSIPQFISSHNSIFLLFVVLLIVSPSFADESVSVSGRLNLRGVQALESDGIEEDPGLEGRIRLDTQGSAWRIHSWLEGGWDGSVKRPARNRSLFKNFDRVYQSNTPYLEVKELYITHSSGDLDVKAGIQRFAWGRLDEYPPNDLLNPWDYTRFLRKPLEDRKIGVPSVSATLAKGEWTCETVWVPVFVPYRLPMPDERWSGISAASALNQVPNAESAPKEPDLPERTIKNSNVGLRMKHAGDIEWALNLFHGYDPRPVFKTTTLVITPQTGGLAIDPGYVPSFHRITVLGMDAAAVSGDWSIRAEAAYGSNRYFNIRPELWGYPAVLAPGGYPLNQIEVRSDTLDYGIGADYRPFEDGLLTMQAQQTLLKDRPDSLFDRKIETVLWAGLKVGWMNQKLETNLSVAYNPEHGARMTEASGHYTFTDAWKAGVTAVLFDGPPQSLFGRFSRNDQIEAEVTFSW